MAASPKMANESREMHHAPPNARGEGESGRLAVVAWTLSVSRPLWNMAKVRNDIHQQFLCKV